MPRKSKKTTPSAYRVADPFDPSASEDDSFENLDQSLEEEQQPSSTPFTLRPARLGDAAHVITQSFLENQGAEIERSLLSPGNYENQNKRDWGPSQTIEVPSVCSELLSNIDCNLTSDTSAVQFIDTDNGPVVESSEVSSIACELCGKVCKNERGLNLHKSRMHKPCNSVEEVNQPVLIASTVESPPTQCDLPSIDPQLEETCIPTVSQNPSRVGRKVVWGDIEGIDNIQLKLADINKKVVT